MKFLLLFLISFSVYSNYVPQDDIGIKNTYIKFTRQADCQEHYKKPCIKQPQGYNYQYYKLIDNIIDGNPIYAAKSEVEACKDEKDCTEKLSLKECADLKFINAEFTEIYCTSITGYEQINKGKIVVVDEAKKATYDNAQALKKAQKDAMAQARKAMQCGKDVQALLLIRNYPKKLTKTQVKTLVKTYTEVKQLLDSGSLETSKAEIEAITPDGIIVTEEDKTALIAAIDSCLGI